MGLKESLITNFKDCTLKYQGKKIYVVDQVEFEKDIYLYVFNIEKLPELEINFLKKIKDDQFEVVTDLSLFDILLANAGIQLATDKINEVIKNKDNKI